MNPLARTLTATWLALALPWTAGAASYLCLGDSITFGENGSNTTAYLGYLGTYLTANQAPAEMINQGLGGENTAGGLSRLQAILPTRPTDYVLIMEGTNDIFTYANDPTFTISDTQANLRDMVRAVRGAGEIPILATIPPRVADSRDPDNAITRQVNDRVRAVASAEGVALAEVFQNVVRRTEALIYRDSLHPNQLGQALIAEAFAAAILGQAVTDIDLTPPLPVTIEPYISSRSNPIDSNVRIVVSEDKHPIDPATAAMRIDGVTVTPVVSTNGYPGQTAFLYEFPQLLGFNRTVRVELTIADTAVPANQLGLDYTFRTTAGNGTNGDIDRSGRVDGIDLAMLAASFGASFRDARYNLAADIDANRVVDGFDLMLLTSRFGGPP